MLTVSGAFPVIEKNLGIIMFGNFVYDYYFAVFIAYLAIFAAAVWLFNTIVWPCLLVWFAYKAVKAVYGFSKKMWNKRVLSEKVF